MHSVDRDDAPRIGRPPTQRSRTTSETHRKQSSAVRSDKRRGLKIGADRGDTMVVGLARIWELPDTRAYEIPRATLARHCRILLSSAVVHFVNVSVFDRLRRGNEMRHMPATASTT